MQGLQRLKHFCKIKMSVKCDAEHFVEHFVCKMYTKCTPCKNVFLQRIKCFFAQETKCEKLGGSAIVVDHAPYRQLWQNRHENLDFYLCKIWFLFCQSLKIHRLII